MLKPVLAAQAGGCTGRSRHSHRRQVAPRRGSSDPSRPPHDSSITTPQTTLKPAACNHHTDLDATRTLATRSQGIKRPTRPASAYGCGSPNCGSRCRTVKSFPSRNSVLTPVRRASSISARRCSRKNSSACVDARPDGPGARGLRGSAPGGAPRPSRPARAAAVARRFSASRRQSRHWRRPLLELAGRLRRCADRADLLVRSICTALVGIDRAGHAGGRVGCSRRLHGRPVAVNGRRGAVPFSASATSSGTRRRTSSATGTRNSSRTSCSSSAGGKLTGRVYDAARCPAGQHSLPSHATTPKKNKSLQRKQKTGPADSNSVCLSRGPLLDSTSTMAREEFHWESG